MTRPVDPDIDGDNPSTEDTAPDSSPCHGFLLVTDSEEDDPATQMDYKGAYGRYLKEREAQEAPDFVAAYNRYLEEREDQDDNDEVPYGGEEDAKEEDTQQGEQQGQDLPTGCPMCRNRLVMRD